MRKVVALLLIIAAVAGAWLWKSHSTSQAEAEGAPIPDQYIAEAERRDIDFTVEVSGDVTPAFQLEVKPEVGGKIKALHVIAGQEVRKGDLLVEIDDADLLTEKAGAMTEIEGAQLSVDKTRRNFERSKELFDSKLISREVYDNLAADLAIAENNLAKAERKLQLVEDKLRKTKIFAPADGTVLSVLVIEGQVVVAAASVNSGTSLMMIADLSRLLVDTHVNQVDVASIEMDQTVRLSSESLRGQDLTAKISFIAPVASVKNNVKGFEVEALIESPTAQLRPGMTVTMSIPVAAAENAVSVPIAAVFSDDDHDKVVYVRNGERTEKRPVTVGISNLQHAEIKSGIAAGEKILLVEPRALQKRS